MKTLRKSCPKHRLLPDVWETLGEFGTRKQFRSKPKKRKHRSHDVHGNPVSFGTGIPTTTKLRIGRSIPSLLICNTRSIVNKVDELECVANYNCVDVICVTKTWLSYDILDSSIAMQNFCLLRKDRTRQGGGIAAYVNCTIPCKRLLDLETLEGISEVLWIQLRPFRLPRKVTSILLGIVYHPPQSTSDDNKILYDHVQCVVDSSRGRVPTLRPVWAVWTENNSLNGKRTKAEGWEPMVDRPERKIDTENDAVIT